MKLKKLIRGVNRNLNHAKSMPIDPCVRANQIIKGIINSSQVEDIFGEWFGSCPYRYTKRLNPECIVSLNSVGYQIEQLRFYTYNLDNDSSFDAKLTNLNQILSSLDYKSLRNDNIIDLSSIEKIQFTV